MRFPCNAIQASRSPTPRREPNLEVGRREGGRGIGVDAGVPRRRGVADGRLRGARILDPTHLSQKAGSFLLDAIFYAPTGFYRDGSAGRGYLYRWIARYPFHSTLPFLLFGFNGRETEGGLVMGSFRRFQVYAQVETAI